MWGELFGKITKEGTSTVYCLRACRTHKYVVLVKKEGTNTVYCLGACRTRSSSNKASIVLKWKQMWLCINFQQHKIVNSPLWLNLGNCHCYKRNKHLYIHMYRIYALINSHIQLLFVTKQKQLFFKWKLFYKNAIIQSCIQGLFSLMWLSDTKFPKLNHPWQVVCSRVLYTVLDHVIITIIMSLLSDDCEQDWRINSEQ